MKRLFHGNLFTWTPVQINVHYILVIPFYLHSLQVNSADYVETYIMACKRMLSSARGVIFAKILQQITNRFKSSCGYQE
jgi:hypothetical protein